MDRTHFVRPLLQAIKHSSRVHRPASCISRLQQNYHVQTTASPLLLRKHVAPASIIARQARFSSTDADDAPPRPLTDRDDSEAAARREKIAALKAEQPSYDLAFTCKKCLERSKHRISKQGYHFGTVLVTCPGCKNRHLISDHMKIFSDKNITLEDIMKEKGQLIKKGVLGADGDVEFYDDKEMPS